MNHPFNPPTINRFALILLVSFIVWISSPKTVSAQAKTKKTTPRAALAGTSLPFASEETYRAIAQFYVYDGNMPLSAGVVEKKEFPEGGREKIVFTGVFNSRVPAYLILPKAQNTPFPVVLLVDGIMGSKERWFEDNSWPKVGLVARALLQAGFAVMALDAVYHGEQGAENNFAGVPSPFTYPYQTNQMVVQTAVEYRRAIDYLFTRPEIDTTRLGMMSLSMGGAIAFALTSIDPPIKAAIAGLTPILIEKEHRFEPWMPTTFAGHIKTIPFLMFMGTKDNYYTMEQARELFNRIPSPKKEFISYQTGHEPPLNMC